MAHASVLSAMHKMERLRLSSNPETKSIYEELCSLESGLQVYAQIQGNKLRFDPLEDQIEGAATKVEDLTEDAYASLCGSCSESSDTKSHGDVTTCNSSFSLLLFEVRQEISSLCVKLNLSKKDYDSMEEDPQQRSCTDNYLSSLTNLPAEIPGVDTVEGAVDDAVSFSSRTSDICRSIKLVGLQEEVEKLLSWVFAKLWYPDSPGWNWRRHIQVPIKSIVGMVGIGKTTLVKQVYDHPRIKDSFDCRLWVTIGPSYNFQEFIRVVSGQIDFHRKSEKRRMYEFESDPGNYEFKSFLFQYLCRRRYLIVLDDIWSSWVWDELQRIFPNNDCGSRVILTSRFFNIAGNSIANDIHHKSFLSDDNSWDLLHGMVFTNPGEHCSYELQKYGKKIAKNCEGLPLAILAVG